MQIKPILKPLLILFIGVVIGVLASGIITMRHLRLAHQIRTERGFLEQASRLDITSSQQDSIEPILKAFAKANQLRHDSLRVREKRALDEFRNHLKPFLSEKELKSLKQILRLKGPKKKRAKNK